MKLPNFRRASSKPPYPGLKEHDELIGPVEKVEILSDSSRHKRIPVCDVPYRSSGWFFEKFVNLFSSD